MTTRTAPAISHGATFSRNMWRDTAQAISTSTSGTVFTAATEGPVAKAVNYRAEEIDPAPPGMRDGRHASSTPRKATRS